METLSVNGFTELAKNELVDVNGGFNIPLPFGGINVDKGDVSIEASLLDIETSLQVAIKE